MVLGHFGVGLGAKKYAPTISLGVLFMAIQFADLLWPDLLLLKMEFVEIQPNDSKFPFNFTYYPFDHSLLMATFWSLVFGAVYYWLAKSPDVRTAIILGLCVLSHWILDLFVHKPDLPLYFGDSPKFGFGLWNFPWLVAVIEGAIFLWGMLTYMNSTRAKNSAGNWGFWLLMVLLVLGHIAGQTSPPPPTVEGLAWGAQVIWVFIFLGFWVDRNREVKPLS
jgi:hypothetical protein